MSNGVFSRLNFILRYSPIYGILLLGFFLNHINLGFSALEVIQPDYVVIILFYWTYQRPRIISPLLLIVLGLFSDVLSNTFLGFKALVYVLAQLVVRSQWRFLMTQAFTGLWISFAMYYFMFEAALWFIRSLVLWNFEMDAEIIIRVALAVFLFPPLAALFSKLQSWLPLKQF